MNRIVLAILALFAGLAAQVAPAEARVGGKVEIGATLGVKASARAVAVAAAAPFRAVREPLVEPPRFGIAAQLLPVLTAQTVHIGPDRARE